VDVRINGERLLRRLGQFANIGGLPNGGVCRLAFSDEDKAGRAQVMNWMNDLGMVVREDAIGNVVGQLDGLDPDLAPVMMGSHIDTVRTGGTLDGNLGVLAGLEIAQACLESGHKPRRGLAVCFFSNEEGSRFQPDMMGSLVYTGALSLDEALGKVDADGISVAQEINRLGLGGTHPIPGLKPHAFVELHIEQGPLLENESTTIGVVTAVQGISWHRLVLHGQSNHAGTAPMGMRKDAGFVAAQINVALRELVLEMGNEMVGTVGNVQFSPNLVNVVPNRVEMTIDLRSPVESTLAEAEERFMATVQALCAAENVLLETERLVRLEPVRFDPDLVSLVETLAAKRGLSHRQMVSGAGHDAQMFAAIAPSCMIFVPSIGGISHNVQEATEEADLIAGCQLLSDVVLRLAN
jgi:beta-ureidopropionase / N-carbamoyl-L-amino-acid hydrolase